MQFPDSYLDGLFASGQKRYWDVLVRFDWNGDNYLSAYADLSTNFVTATLDSQINGELPVELQQEEGYSTARLDLTLEGYLDVDGVACWKAFSPGAGHYLGQQARLGTHMQLAIVVHRQDTGQYLQIFQFTGEVDTIRPGRKDGTVVMTCYDYTALLAKPVTLPQWSTDWTNRYYYGWTDSNDSMWQSLAWPIEAAARQAGFFSGPRPHSGAQVWWPLTSGSLPEIGTIAQWDNNIPEWNYRGWITPGQMEATAPKVSFGPAKFGNGYIGRSAVGSASAKTITAPHNNAASSGSNYYLGSGQWMYFDPAGQGVVSNTYFFHENMPATGNAAETLWNWGGTGAAAQQTVKVSNSTTGSQVWNFAFQSPVAVPTGWHWVGMVVEFTTAQVNAWINIDGTITQMTRTAGSGVMANFLYSFPTGGTNRAGIGAYNPTQYAQIWVQSAPSATTASVWPEQTPPFTNMKIDTSETKIFHIPSIDGVAAGDVIKAASGAEFGALYCTETGVITWDSYTTLLGRRLASNVVKTFTVDDLADFQPFLSLMSIANSISYEIKQRWSRPGKAFQLATPGQFVVAAGAAPTYPITIQDVQALRSGMVTFQPQAMGYTLSGGSVTNWKDWMQYYAPDTWDDGFTGYVPGSNTDPSTQPTYQTGVNAYAMLGWAAGDQNQRHMRLQLQNSSGSSIEYAVNDQTAFLNVRGLIIADQVGYTASVSNAASITSLGTQLLTLGQSDWRSDSITVAALMQRLVDATAVQRYQVDTVEVPGDPRVQRQDVVLVSDVGGMGSIYASIIGINRTISKKDGIKDVYTLRTFTP